jgi:hypothetical protein
VVAASLATTRRPPPMKKVLAIPLYHWQLGAANLAIVVVVNILIALIK